jgi:hypothetical protein
MSPVSCAPRLVMPALDVAVVWDGKSGISDGWTGECIRVLYSAVNAEGKRSDGRAEMNWADVADQVQVYAASPDSVHQTEAKSILKLACDKNVTLQKLLKSKWENMKTCVVPCCPSTRAKTHHLRAEPSARPMAQFRRVWEWAATSRRSWSRGACRLETLARAGAVAQRSWRACCGAQL